MKNYGRIALFALVGLPLLAAAHPTLEQKSAPAGSYYKGIFKIGHGCDGAATTSIMVTIPEGVVGAKPMPKPGWTLSTRSEKLAKPYDSHGRKVDEAVVEVTWSDGKLADAWYDEFVVAMKLPETAGKLWFKVKQACSAGSIDWVQIPEGKQTARELKAPAVSLDVLSGRDAPHH